MIESTTAIAVSEENTVAVTEQATPAVIYLGAVPVRDDDEMLLKASSIAQSLTGIIKDQKLYTKIGNKNHVNIEGWTTLLAMLGIVPVEVDMQRTEKGSYTATVELRRIDTGQMITRASAECGIDEKEWSARKSYARRSMALTRATGKAARMAYSWIIVMAGYSPTPTDEMPMAERVTSNAIQESEAGHFAPVEPAAPAAVAPTRSADSAGYGSEKQMKRAFAIINSAKRDGMPEQAVNALLTEWGCVDENGRPTSTYFPNRDAYNALLDNDTGLITNWNKNAANNEQQQQSEFNDDIPF
jgi:hypothetical protein